MEIKGKKSLLASQDFTPPFSASDSLEELNNLALSAGAAVLSTICQTRDSADSATFLGSGKAIELQTAVKALDCDLVIFDQELSPSQQRNLEKMLEVRVIDRTQLILDIFARRARTREGQLQVELAQLNYLLPRLSGQGLSMSRQGGGIGTLGPGETKLETDRRQIRTRISKLERAMNAVRGTRSIQRMQRQGIPLATLALVGYTNAGKSTLFNHLTRAGVEADARMFATLDPTVRALELPSHRRVLFSDTVGFIRQLPTTVVRAFRATLEEVCQATLLLHVVDISSPHWQEHARHVEAVLKEIGASETPRLLVANKVDCLLATASLPPDCVGISAAKSQGIGNLLAAVDRMLAIDPIERCTFALPASDGAAIHLIHSLGKVLSRIYDGDTCRLDVEAPESLRQRLKGYIDKAG